MALFFYEQWTCSLKKCHGASFGNGLKEEVEKHVFCLWMNIKTFRFKESVTFEKMEIKDMGELLAVAMSRGKCHWQKIRAVLASRLTASASSCSLLACRQKRQRGPETQSLFILSLWGCQTQGAVQGHIWDTMDLLDWTILQFWDRTSCLPWLCRLLWQEVTWHGQRASGIIMIIFYFVFFLFSFHINVSMNKKGKPRQFWYHDIPVFQVQLFVFPWFIGMMLFYSFKERHNISIQREKNSNNVN